jgi:hypothetical protein
MKLFLLLVSATSSLALAQSPRSGTFCALDLLVVLPNGNPVVAATADLLDERGYVVKTAEVKVGKASFCDFDFGPHSLRVQHEASLPVVLLGIKLVYGIPQHLVITLNPLSPGSFDGSAGNACRAYVRAEDLKRGPLNGVRAEWDGNSMEGDEFGRFLLLVPLGRFTTFTFPKSGFRADSLILSCSGPGDVLLRTVYLDVAR